MKIEVTHSGACKREVNIQVESGDLQGEWQRVCDQYARRSKIPGFRPGKAPLQLVKQRYKEAIKEDFLDAAVRKYFGQALTEEKLSPVGSPKIQDLQFDEGQPLRFKALIEVLPDLDLSDYKGLEIEKIEAQVSEEEVDHTIARIRERFAEFLPVEPRPVQSGDFVVISYHGRFVDGSRPDFDSKDVLFEVDGPESVPEFSENIKGAEVGETRPFTVKYGAEFPNKSLAGAEIEYAVTVQEIKSKKLPELNDDFAKDAGDYSSFQELRSKIAAELLANKEDSARSEMQQKLLNLVIEKNPFDVPDVMVSQQVETRLEEYARSLVLQGIHPRTLNIDWAEFRERQRERAVRDVQAALVLEHIAEKEGIEVTDEEVEAEIRSRAEELKQPLEAVKSRLTKDGGADRIRTRIRNRKSLGLILNLATLKTPQGTIVQP
ncbi:MAG: trigger factor [Acidobacteriota bacterium]